MKVTAIKESGCNNLLLWAIKNGAKIKQDSALQSLINDELMYLVTFSDVTFFEMFRLTQMYRDDLAIIATKPASIPPVADLQMRFPGKFKDEKSGEEMLKSQMVAGAIDHFINLALQMQADDDIIQSYTPQLYLPMISRRYDVQIPIPFTDIISYLRTPEDAEKLFNGMYPSNLTQEVIENPESPIVQMLMLGFTKAVDVIHYNKTYDKYLRGIKYTGVNRAKSDKLYKFTLSGFHKRDNISRGEIRCSMFNPNKEVMANTLKKLNNSPDSLKIDFMVQMPIHYMQILLNTFSYEEIGIRYESSMTDIIDSGMIQHNFSTFDFTQSSTNPGDEQKIEAAKNTINAYHTRINEANQIALGLIQILLSGDTDTDRNSAFSLLPGIYSTKAQITLDLKYANKYAKYPQDPMIAAMLNEMLDMASGITSNIVNSR